MGDVCPPNPSQYEDLFKCYVKIFKENYWVVEKNDLKISASKFQEMDAFAKAIVEARDHIIVSKYYDDSKTDVNDAVEKVCLAMMKLE